MGTLRWAQERAVRRAAESAEAAARLRRVLLDTEEAQLDVRLKSLQTERVAQRNEKALRARATASRVGEAPEGNSQLRELRGADEKPGARAR